MTLSHFAIQGIVPYITGDENSPRRNGRNLVELFNSYGSRDVYVTGLPANPKRKDGQGMSRKEYVENRLLQLNGQDSLRLLLEQVINEADNKGYFLNKFNELLIPEGFSVVINEDQVSIQGGVVDRTLPVINEAHFQDIQTRILAALDSARVSIWIAMAWFTNGTLFNKLVEKHRLGINVELVIYDDGVNRTHGVDFSQLNYTPIRRADRGGLMHDKFCVIDNQIVITGSYNWTNNAEYRNEENITIERDPNQATLYSEQFRRLKPILIQ